MTRSSFAILAMLALLPAAADAATSSSAFRVGITIAHECRVDRMPGDATDVALDCDADAASRTTVRTIDTAAAWPRATEPVAGTPRSLRDVAIGDASRMIVVEY